MRIRTGTRNGLVPAFVFLHVLAAGAMGISRAEAGITVALTTPSTTVAPGAEFDVFIQTTVAGSSFNAYDATIGYDPSALTPVSLSPLSLQEGTLMVNACGSRFHRFRQGADRDTVTLVLLCNGVSVTGPGQLYRLRFHASNTPQSTTIRFLPGLRFYNAGVVVAPVISSDLTITIGNGVGVEDPPGVSARGSSVRAMPNPSRSSTTLLVESTAAGRQELLVCDVRGRVLRRLESGWFEAGWRRTSWDGRSESGDPLPAGVYYIRLRTPSGVRQTTLVRIR